MPSRLTYVEDAPAKINLTLAVLGRRRDGYHLLESLVAFADIGDRLSLVPGGTIKLIVRGLEYDVVGRLSRRFGGRAAHALAREMPGLILGRFTLVKNLPVAAGLGGGSSDAAAALRLLARANRLKLNDPRIVQVAVRIGADVPVCLDPRPRLMRGIGEELSAPVRIPKLHVLLVNPGVALATKDVFVHFDRKKSPARLKAANSPLIPQWRSAFVATLANGQNDLEAHAIALVPDIAGVLEALRESSGCRLARMSGSGATCFGIFPSARAAASAARRLKSAHQRWWVKTTAVT